MHVILLIKDKQKEIHNYVSHETNLRNEKERYFGNEFAFRCAIILY